MPHFLHNSLFLTCVKEVARDAPNIPHGPKQRVKNELSRERVLHACFCLWRHSFSLRCIQTGVSVLSGELMFILGSQIPTFPNRARLTWKSTDAFFIRLPRSLRTGPGSAEEKMVWRRCWHLYKLSTLLATLY